MFMEFIWPVVLCVGLMYLYRMSDSKNRSCLSFCESGERVSANDSNKGGLLFFRVPEPFISAEDVEKIAIEAMNSEFNTHLKANSKKQKKINSSIGFQVYKIKQWFQNRKLAILRVVKMIAWKDVLVLFFYMILPGILLLLFGGSRIEEFTGFQTLVVKIGEIKVDLYLAQLSLTFITISVMSIFSDGNAVIYWQNIVRQMLIEPPMRCFKAYFWYSFIYLLLGTISLIFSYEEGIAVFFLFNIICLFDLSRIMINCYYGQNAKKQRLISEFTGKIEKANRAYFENSKNEGKAVTKKLNNQYLKAVEDIFDDFNYYTNQAFNEQKYITVKENLMVYGKMLARVHPASVDSGAFPLMDWYNDRTYKVYRDVVKNYYDEYNYLIFRGGYSIMTWPGKGNRIERENIDPIIDKLSNDIHNVRDVSHCYELLLYKFLTMICFVARKVDFENLKQYAIPRDDFADESWFYWHREQIGENVWRLCQWYRKNKTDTGHIYDHLVYVTFVDAIAELISNTVLINTQDLLILDFSWLPWEELKLQKEQIIKMAGSYVEDKTKACSEERKAQCKKRLEGIVFAAPKGKKIIKS